MAAKLFAVRDKTTKTVQRLIKAETKGQVNKHLATSVIVEVIGALDAVEIAQEGKIRIEDATAEVAGDGEDGDGEGSGGQPEVPAQTVPPVAPAAPAAADAPAA